MRAVVGERLMSLVESVLQVEAPARDADLIDGGLLDSLALVHLLAAIEDEFTIEVPLDEVELDRVRTIESLSDLVVERLTLAASDAA